MARLAAVAALVAASAGLAKAYNPAEANVLAACGPLACKSTWHAWEPSLTLPCAAASGHLPAGILPLQLPLLFEGNYDLCRTFEDAHFCSIQSTMPLVVPTSHVAGLKPFHLDVGGFPLGPFRLDQCVSKSCDPEALWTGFNAQLESLAHRLLKLVHANASATEAVEKLVHKLRGSLEVSCVDSDEIELDGVGWSTLIVLGAFAAVALVATVIVAWGGHGAPAADSAVVRWFAMNKNGARLVAAIPGDFNALNGIRFLSMCWVITGHTVLAYTNVANPSAVARVVTGFSFVFIRGAEYAVDTFFLMSGFLATWGMVQQFRKRRLSPRTYGMLMLGRFLRLTPTYALVVLVYWKVLPTMSTGPNWSAASGTARKACDDNWIFNLLYVNNIFPWGQAGAMDICAGWTWYLANDFQFFLLAPVIAQLYLDGMHSSGLRASLLKWAPSLVLVVTQLVVTSAELAGMGPNPSSDPNFADRVYTKPWCRMTPYVVGVALALFHFERVESAKAQAVEEDGREQEAALLAADEPAPAWKTIRGWPHGLLPQALLVGGVAAMFALVCALFDQFRCEASEHECQVWLAQFKFGFFILPNWSKGVVVFYYAWCYLFWSLGLAAFIYVLFCDDRYDVLRVKWALAYPAFTPLARLTYNAYLVHIPVIVFVAGQARHTSNWVASRIALEVVGYIFFAYLLSLALYLVVEKPVMNMTSTLFHASRPKAAVADADARGDGWEEGEEERGSGRGNGARSDRLPLDRQFSSVSDIDSETVHMAAPPHRGAAAPGSYSRLD